MLYIVINSDVEFKTHWKVQLDDARVEAIHKYEVGSGDSD